MGQSMHTVQVAGANTLFPRYKRVRVDGASSSWNPLTERALVAFYQAMGYEVVYIFDLRTWLADNTYVGKLRDVLSIVKPDYLDLCNEPDITYSGYITPAQYHTALTALRNTSQRFLGSVCTVVGPSVSNWLSRKELFGASEPAWDGVTNLADVDNGKSWGLQHIALGTHRMLDQFWMHGYLDLGTGGIGTAPEDIAGKIQNAGVLTGLHVHIGEFTIDSTRAAALPGAPSQATVVERFRVSAASVGSGTDLYTGPNDGGGECMLEAGNAALNAFGLAVAANLVTANVHGVGA